MKSYLPLSVLLAVFLTGGSAVAAESHPNWAEKSGQLTISSGNTWIATEEDMAAITRKSESDPSKFAVTRITIESGAQLVFSNTTSWVAQENLFWSSAGTIVKKGPSTITVSNISNYRVKGTLVVEDGVFLANTGSYPWGGTTNSCVRVLAGATYRHNTTSSRGWTKTIIAGNGYQDQGAFVVDKSAECALANLELSDDATLALNATGNILAGFSDGGKWLQNKFPGELNLAGHTLTITGSAATVTISNDIVTPGEGGAIKFAAGRARAFVRSGSTTLGATKLIADGDLVLTTGTWTNEIEVLEGAALVLKPSSSSTSLSVQGLVTGAGDVSVGTAEAAAAATVSLVGGNLSISGSIKLFGNCDISFDGNGVLPAVEWTSGSLNVVAPVSAKVTVSDESLRGTSPSWLKFNGEAASVGADGSVFFDGIYGIAAKGDAISDAPSSVVGIVREGTGGNTGLADADVAVETLVNYIDSAATIAVNAGETLTAGSLRIGTGAGDLTIGETSGVGTLAGAGGTLEIPGTGDSTITVKTSAAADTDVRIDSGSLVLAGGFANTGSVHIAGGTVSLTGPEPFYLGETVVGTNRAVDSKLVIDGANVVIEKSRLYVGARYGGNNNSSLYSANIGRALVTNSTLVAGGSDSIVVGQSSYAVLEVAAGAYVTNRLYLGGMYGYNSFGSQGAVYQTGGIVSIPAGSGTVGIGIKDGNGYYRLDDGELYCQSSFGVGIYSPGMLDQRGGVINYGTNTFYVSSANGGKGTACFSGGKAMVPSCLTGQGKQGAMASFVVEGDADVTCPYLSAYTSLAGSPASYVYKADLVFNGGVFRTKGVRRHKTNDHPMTVNFSGGTWKVTGDNANLFSYASNSSYTNPVLTAVYSGGMTIDTDGHTGAFASMPITGAYGGGVRSVSLANPITGYACAPAVFINGDGYGAVAVADFDVKTGALNGIRVVSPGCGYTTPPTVSVYRARSYALSSVTCTIAENENTGSFTKKGAGDFTLRCANTWGGDTILEGGELVLGAAGALPAGSKVVYRGGTLKSSAAASPAAFTADISALVETERRVPLVTYTDSLPETLPDVTLEGGDVSMWRVTRRGLSLYAAKNVGAVLILK